MASLASTPEDVVVTVTTRDAMTGKAYTSRKSRLQAYIEEHMLTALQALNNPRHIFWFGIEEHLVASVCLLLFQVHILVILWL